MTVLNPNPPDPRDRSNLLAGAIVLGLLIVGAAVLVWALVGGFGDKHGTVHAVYFPGIPQVDAGAEVLFLGQHVGEVVKTDPPRAGLQLLATAIVVPEVTQVVTLFPGDSVRLADPASGPVTLALPSLSELAIRGGSGSYTLRRASANRWTVDQSGSGERLVVNGRPLDPDRPAAIQVGDQLAWGRIRLEWQDVAEVSRVGVRIALDKLRKAAGLPDTVGEAYLLGPRSSITISNAFGLGKPVLRLEPDFGRAAFVTGPERVIAGAPTVDLERTVQGMLSYLNSPAALRRDPATRFERVVSDLNRSLEQVSVLGGQVDSLLRRANAVAAEQGGRGMVGRLVLEPRTLDTLHAVASRLAVLTTPLADTTRSILARLKLDTLESGVKAAVGSATGTFHRIDTTAMRVSGLADSLQSVIRIVNDSLPPALGRVNGLLDQGTGAAKTAKVVIPVALISGIGVAVTGILKMLGVF